MSEPELHEDCCYCGTDAGAADRERITDLANAGQRHPLPRKQAAELRRLLLPRITEALADQHGTDCMSRHELDAVAIAMRDVEVCE